MNQRLLRLNELILRHLSLILHQDYPTKALYISLNAVRVSPDSKQARVFYSILGGEKEAARAFLSTHSKALRGELSKRLSSLKSIPTLFFKYDNSLEQSSAVLHILDELDAQPPSHS